MPIGVPKVPYWIPGDEEETWVDIYDVLHRERTLFLGEEIRCEITSHIVGLMIYLNMEDGNRDLFLFINSPGGWIMSAMAIFDTMSTVTPDVYTICIGIAASMASFILLGGEPSKRIAFPHARIMLNQPSSAYYWGSAGECFLEAEELWKMREMITRVYALRTAKPLSVIHEDMERGLFLSATEAKAYGIVDIVGDDVDDERIEGGEEYPDVYRDYIKENDPEFDTE